MPISPTDHVFAPTAQIDRFLLGIMESQVIAANLRDAMTYALVGGGKRLRPILAWHSSVAVGAHGEASLSAGAAVECVHAFSLVHDDLPALDNDDLRRGRPTLHKHAGEAMAILAGDALLALAFSVLTSRAQAHQSHIGDMVACLAGATTAMVSGQVRDTLGGFPPSLSPADAVRLVHSEKTGALIHASCLLGAWSCGRPLSDAAFRAIDSYGRHIGLIFQIVDDIIDVTQSSEHAGKRTGKDAEAGKLTYPGVHGVPASRTMVTELADSALASLAPLGPNADGLRDLCNYLATRTK